MDHETHQETMDKSGDVTLESKNPAIESVKAKKENKIVLWIKKNFRILIVVFIVLVAGISYLLLNKSNTAKAGKAPPPDPENVLLATVGERKIYRNDVRGIALEQFTGSAITNKVIKDTLNIAVERAVLDNEAAAKNLHVDKGSSKLQYYNALKEEIISKEIGSVTTNSISFWVPAFHDIYPQKPEYQEMRDQANKILMDAASRLRSGESSYDIGKSIITKYPVYAPQLAVNGYVISKMTDATLMQKPTINQYLVNDSNKLYMDFIFSLKKGEVKILVWPDGEGAAVVQAVDKNIGDKITYNVWLKNKEKNVLYSDNNIHNL